MNSDLDLARAKIKIVYSVKIVFAKEFRTALAVYFLINHNALYLFCSFV